MGSAVITQDTLNSLYYQLDETVLLKLGQLEEGNIFFWSKVSSPSSIYDGMLQLDNFTVNYMWKGTLFLKYTTAQIIDYLERDTHTLTKEQYETEVAPETTADVKAFCKWLFELMIDAQDINEALDFGIPTQVVEATYTLYLREEYFLPSLYIGPFISARVLFYLFAKKGKVPMAPKLNLSYEAYKAYKNQGWYTNNVDKFNRYNAMLPYITPPPLHQWKLKREAVHILKVLKLQFAQLRRLPPRPRFTVGGVRSGRLFQSEERIKRAISKIRCTFCMYEKKLLMKLTPKSSTDEYNFPRFLTMPMFASAVFKIYLEKGVAGLGDSHSIGGVMTRTKVMLLNGWMLPEVLYTYIRTQYEVKLQPSTKLDLYIFPNDLFGFSVRTQASQNPLAYNIQGVACSAEGFGECSDFSIILPGEVVENNAFTVDKVRAIYDRMSKLTVASYNTLLRKYALI